MHLPVLLALSLPLMVHASDGPPDSLLTHLRPLVTPRPPGPPSKSAPQQDVMLQFTKKLYKDLGNYRGNTTMVVDKYQDEFDMLDKRTGGGLRETLSTLFEIRMLDLQASIRHAKQMRKVIDEFTGKLIPPESI
jgi:hypothetical protein